MRVLLTTLLGMATAASADVPAALKPQGIAGSGFNVRDLEAERAWYLDMLGMKLINTYSRDGKPFEYILGYGGQGNAVLALLLSTTRAAGPNTMGRLILLVPNAKALADHLKGRGVEVREWIPSVAYGVIDPEGNPVELYTPPVK